MSQKKRKLGDEKRYAAKAKSEKSLGVRFIQEAQYMTWLANVVTVKK